MIKWTKEYKSDSREMGMAWKPYETCFASVDEAANAWANRYRSQSAQFEYAALIFSTKRSGETCCYISKTYKGMKSHLNMGIRPNVVVPLLHLYGWVSIKEKLLRNSTVEAFIHSHPEPPSGHTYRNPSKEDRMLLKLRNIKTVYVIPYENGDITKV